MSRPMIPQHEPLRVPDGWNDKEKALIVQLERILTDIYKHFRPLKSEDFSDELLADLENRMNGG